MPRFVYPHGTLKKYQHSFYSDLLEELCASSARGVLLCMRWSWIRAAIGAGELRLQYGAQGAQLGRGGPNATASCPSSYGVVSIAGIQDTDTTNCHFTEHGAALLFPAGRRSQLPTMEVEESILMKQNNRPQESIEGKIVHFKPSVEDVHQRSRPVPLDVYGKPEIYRWRTAYDEAYNMDSQGRWKYE